MSSNPSQIPSSPSPIPPDPSIAPVNISPIPHRSSHISHHHRLLPSLDIVTQLILYQYGVFLTQLPKHLFSLIYENSMVNDKSLSGKDIEKLQRLPEKIKLVLKAIKPERLLNDLKNTENPFKGNKGDFKEKTPLESLIFQKLKKDLEQIQKEKSTNNLEESGLSKNPNEDKAAIKEKLLEKPNLYQNDKNLDKDIKNGEEKKLTNRKAGFILNKNKDLLKTEKGLVTEKTGQIGTIKTEPSEINTKIQKTQSPEKSNENHGVRNKDERSKEKAPEKTVIKHQNTTSTNNFKPAERPENFIKSEFKPINQEKLTESDKQSGKFVKGETFVPNVDIKDSIPYTGFFVVPYFLQERVKVLLSKTEKFKFKKVVKKEKNPSHEKQGRDNELDYPTVDDIS